MKTTKIKFPIYFPIINLYLLIFGKTINPVLLLNSEQMIPEKNRHAANKVKKEINLNPPLKNVACVSDKRFPGIS